MASSGIHQVRERPKLMVVDDDADIRAALTLVFEGEGFSVVALPDGEAALEHLHGDELPSVVLLDLMMPRCSGWEVLAACAKSERLRHLPIVVMTALDPLAAELPLTVAHHVAKPLDIAALVERARALAHLGRSAPPLERERAV